MKLDDVVGITKNSANNQISFNLKARKLNSFGLTPEQLLKIKIPKSFIERKVKKEVKTNGRNKTKSN